MQTIYVSGEVQFIILKKTYIFWIDVVWICLRYAPLPNPSIQYTQPSSGKVFIPWFIADMGKP
jgi:hypothetical protein